MKTHNTVVRRFFLILLGLTLVPFFAHSAWANEITVAGSTSETGVLFPMTFTGLTFGPTSTAGGVAGFTNLGSFFLPITSDIYNNSIDVLVTFTLPAVIGATSFLTDLQGTVITGVGGVQISFTNPKQHIIFTDGSGGSGSFDFTLNGLFLTPGTTGYLSGGVSNGTFTASIVSAPEPASILLLGVGLLFVPVLRRRRS